MAKITKEKYKKDLKDFIRGEIVNEYTPGAPNKGLRYWVDYCKNKKVVFDEDLKTKGVDVE